MVCKEVPFPGANSLWRKWIHDVDARDFANANEVNQHIRINGVHASRRE
jgi:hypothetical protein